MHKSLKSALPALRPVSPANFDSPPRETVSKSIVAGNPRFSSDFEVNRSLFSQDSKPKIIPPTKPKNAPLLFLKKMKAQTASDQELGIANLKEDARKDLTDNVSNVWKALISAVQIIDDLYSLNNLDRNRDKKVKDNLGDPAVNSFRDVLCPKPVIIADKI